MFRSMSAEEYIKQRIEQQQKWYDEKAVKAKSAYLKIRTVAVVGAVLVPVAANVDITGYMAYRTALTTIISLMVRIVVALDSVYHFGDQWKNYRSTEQYLSKEKFLFQTGEGAYKDADPEKAFILLAERCEEQIQAENSATLNVISSVSQKLASVSEKTT